MGDNPPPYSVVDQKAGQAPQPMYPGQNVVAPVAIQAVIPVKFQQTPTRLKCQFCGAEVVTSTHFKSGMLTYFICFMTALVIPLGCCLIPFCVKTFKDVIHTCPSCEREVGRYNRM